MMTAYTYVMSGHDFDGQNWTIEGRVTAASLSEAMTEAHRDAFPKLTGGKAVYGEPGKTCRGPYTVTKFSIEKTQ